MRSEKRNVSEVDRLLGGEGRDIYLFQRGGGRDGVWPGSVTAKNDDVTRTAADIAPGEVELRLVGGNAELMLLDDAGNATADVMALVDYQTTGQVRGGVCGCPAGSPTLQWKWSWGTGRWDGAQRKKSALAERGHVMYDGAQKCE